MCGAFGSGVCAPAGSLRLATWGHQTAPRSAPSRHSSHPGVRPLIGSSGHRAGAIYGQRVGDARRSRAQTRSSCATRHWCSRRVVHTAGLAGGGMSVVPSSVVGMRDGDSFGSGGGTSAYRASELSASMVEEWIDQLAEVSHDLTDAERIDQISELERLKSAAAAAQARLTADLDASQRAVQASAGVPSRRVRHRDRRPGRARPPRASGSRSAAPRPGQGAGARDAPHAERTRRRPALRVADHASRPRDRLPFPGAPAPGRQGAVFSSARHSPGSATGQSRRPHKRSPSGSTQPPSSAATPTREPTVGSPSDPPRTP